MYTQFNDFLFEKKFSSDERKELAKSGKALPNGSYPIVDVHDLKDAIHAYGRGKDKAEVKAWIIKRAKELGQDNLIPKEWE
jgi:hypothetical protein